MSIDPNIVTAEVAANLIKDSLNLFFESAGNVFAVKRAEFLEKFGEYCNHNYTRCSIVRTIYAKNTPIHLNTIYVESRFQVGEKYSYYYELNEQELINHFVNGQRIIVKGNGGSGKTIFLKHLWLSRLKNSKGRIPVLIELRRLNEMSTPNLQVFCRSELRAASVLNSGAFEILCEKGKFEFIFDGFDELNRDIRRNIERQIIDFADQYKKCSFMVSGREDDRFTSWSDFETYSVCPMKLEEVKTLIEKIPFDRKVKKKFLEALNEEFYKKHISFLSSPLLASMMLMTFSDTAIIPEKLTGFYDNAFSTLLLWHDATKDSFERNRTLSVDEFRRVFSTFCLISYYDQSFEFDEGQFRTYISKALTYHKLDLDVDNVKTDFCESVNLLQKDGLNYVFVHRSFQEYFAAECAMRVVSGRSHHFLSAFAERQRDNVFQMCWEIHPEQVFDNFLGSRIDEFIENHNQLRTEISKKKLGQCSSFASSFEFIITPKTETFFPTDILANSSNQAHLKFMNLLRRTMPEKQFKDVLIVIYFGIHECVREGYRAANTKLASGIKLSLTVSLAQNGFTLSLRNTGDVKLPVSGINDIKRSIGEALKMRTKRLEEQVKRETQRFFDCAIEIKENRQQKGASIDSILGLN